MKKEKIVLVFIALITFGLVVSSFLYKILRSDDITMNRILSIDKQTKVLQILLIIILTPFYMLPVSEKLYILI